MTTILLNDLPHTDYLEIGQAVTITPTGTVLVEIQQIDTVIVKERITAAKRYGPYTSGASFKVTVISGTCTVAQSLVDNRGFITGWEDLGLPEDALETTPDDADEFYINDGGVSKRIAYSTLFRGAATITAVTTTATPAATDTRTIYTNEGDTDGATITLPAAAAGLQFTAYVQTAQTLTVTAASGDTIRIASEATAAAGSITSAVVGSSVTLVAINATEWVAISSVGSWSFGG